ncbi:MAG: hypothetical protein J6I49_01775 [Bacteroidales bacterium]|nr:hypothetical protein [Bacteroidales bacterium]
MTPSLYGLLQYLLLFPEETVKRHTCYFLGYAVPRTVSDHLPAVHVDARQTASPLAPSRWLHKLWLRISKDWRWPFLRHAQIYALDLGFVGPLIGSRDYSLLSDGPRCMSQNMQQESVEYQRQMRKHRTLTGRLETLLYGPVATHTYGNNPQCKRFYMTEENESPVYGGRPVVVRSLQEMWNGASEGTWALVKRVFNLDEEDLSLLRSRRVIFLTQPLMLDCGLTEEENAELLRRLVAPYGEADIVFKVHPRDRFDYRRHFPHAAVYDKSVNMQLLVLLGASVQRAVTICSTAINSFPESVQADWYGPQVHSKIVQAYGTNIRPMREYNQI